MKSIKLRGSSKTQYSMKSVHVYVVLFLGLAGIAACVIAVLMLSKGDDDHHGKHDDPSGPSPDGPPASGTKITISGTWEDPGGEWNVLACNNKREPCTSYWTYTISEIPSGMQTVPNQTITYTVTFVLNGNPTKNYSQTMPTPGSHMEGAAGNPVLSEHDPITNVWTLKYKFVHLQSLSNKVQISLDGLGGNFNTLGYKSISFASDGAVLIQPSSG